MTFFLVQFNQRRDKEQLKRTFPLIVGIANKRSIHCSYGSGDVKEKQLFSIEIIIGQNMPHVI